MREEWERGASNGRFTRGELECFYLRDEYWCGPLSEDDFTALKEAWKGLSREGEGPLKLEEIRVALYKKKEYKWVVERRWKSPYRYWEGWTGREREGEKFMDQEEREGERFADREENWEGEGEESEDWEESVREADGWGGFPGERESWEGEGEEGRDGEKVTDREESWEGSTGKEESSTDPQA